MKTNTIFTLAILLLSCIISCKKNIEQVNSSYPALHPSRLDTNAGTWKPILLNSADEFPCKSPIINTSSDYKLQLSEVKSYQANITKEEADLVKYWGAGAVLRWNEIMRELVAKHNIPPYQNIDGTYPIPNSNNPLAYPTFPFSNPPYAARAYAYLSCAQYDACIAVYHYKSLYNQKAPYQIDSTIHTMLPRQNINSYPSEDAAILGASVRILKLLFPGDQEYINQKAEEHKRARLIAGMNVRNDLESGQDLGEAIAEKFIARARTDNAGAAVGNKTIWDKLVTDCEASNEIPWSSLESPKRPPMLPLFGKVRAWLFDSTTLVNHIRPSAPPSTKSEKFKTELEEVYQTKLNLTRAQQKIALYWADGIGTYTPPGHWNYIAANAFVEQHFSEARWARNMSLLNMSMMDAAIACWDAKYIYFNPRPSQMDPRITTDVGVPNFPAYISGHSTFSGAAATTLAYIIPSKVNEFDSLAKEASISRLYGAIHYRSDCEIGLITGNKIGNLAIARGLTDGAE